LFPVVNFLKCVVAVLYSVVARPKNFPHSQIGSSATERFITSINWGDGLLSYHKLETFIRRPKSFYQNSFCLHRANTTKSKIHDTVPIAVNVVSQFLHLTKFYELFNGAIFKGAGDQGTVGFPPYGW